MRPARRSSPRAVGGMGSSDWFTRAPQASRSTVTISAAWTNRRLMLVARFVTITDRRRPPKIRCWQWIDELLALVGLPPVRRSISLPLARRIGAALELFHREFRPRVEPRMTRFLAAQLGRSHYFDISRARQDFGYNPAVSTAEG